MAWPLKTVRTASFLGIIILVAVVLFGVWFVSFRERKWAALEKRVAQLKEDLNASTLARVSLGRPRIPGNAWDDYLRLASNAPETALPRDFGKALQKASREERDVLISSHAVWVDLIRKGARRESSGALPHRILGPRTTVQMTFDRSLQDVASLCVATSQQAAEAGQLQEALDLLLDLFLCGREFAGNRVPGEKEGGTQTMQMALYWLQELSGRLDPSMLQTLDGHLSTLDESFPDTSGKMLGHLLEYGELLIQEDHDDCVLVNFSPDRSRRHWRYLYSSRLEAAATFALADHFVQEAQPMKDHPWTTAGPATHELEERVEAQKDPLLSCYLTNTLHTCFGRALRTYLRMVRIAVHYRATGQLQGIDNPDGGTIYARLTKDTLLIWNKRLFGPDDEQPPGNDAREWRDCLRLELPTRK